MTPNGSIGLNGTTSEEEFTKMLDNNDEQHMDGTGDGEKKENAEEVHVNVVPTRRFSDSTRLNVDRGLNIINCWSGHQMAAWTYESRKPIDKKYLTWKGEPKVRSNNCQFELKLDGSSSSLFSFDWYKCWNFIHNQFFSLLTAHCSLLTAHSSLLTAHCSLLTACSLHA